MKILIIEDERSSALRLEKLICKYKKLKNISIEFAETINSANTKIETVNYDLVFLDLNLNSKSGFEVLQDINSNNFLTIIVSAHTDQAIKAFEYGVLDFVPKPVFEDRLFKSLEKVQLRSNNETGIKKIFIKNKNITEAIPLSSVIYFRPADHYTEIILANGNKKLHNLSLDKIEKILPAQFERTHRSYIVNTNFIIGLQNFPGSKYELKLKNSEKLPVGRKFVKILREKIMN